MKINKSVTFSENTKNILNSYLTNCGDKPAWDAPEVENVKKEAKDHYKKEQKYQCAYCGNRILVTNNSVWDLDHIIPKDLAPQFMFHPENLCISCRDCNGYKRTKPVTSYSRLPKRKYPDHTKFVVVHPHYDHYSNHIRIISNSIYLALTDKGQYTIEVCGLSRFFRMKLDYSEPVEFVELIREYHDLLSNENDPIIIKHLVEVFKLKTQLLSQKC